jgi:uncharacterized protein (DUF488 family)
MAPMTSTIFTIGFTKKTAEQFFRLLQDAGVQRLIDIRENRGGQLAGFAKFPDIAFFLQRVLGIEYIHEPLLAPSPEIRQAYRKTKDWPAYEKSFLELMEQRRVLDTLDPNQYEGKIALLCSEAGPEKCHRRLVAERLSQCWNGMGHHVEVRHLVIDRPVAHRKRKARNHEGDSPI